MSLKTAESIKACDEDNISDKDTLQTDQNVMLLRRPTVNLSITDGPFAETKEHLGGILVLDTED